MLYRTSTYRTIGKTLQIIELSDFSYGEWIVYDNNVPRFHVIVSNPQSESDLLINSMIENRLETIESILDKINLKYSLSLSLKYKPLLSILQSFKLEEWNLQPIPLVWIENLI